MPDSPDGPGTERCGGMNDARGARDLFSTLCHHTRCRAPSSFGNRIRTRDAPCNPNPSTPQTHETCLNKRACVGQAQPSFNVRFVPLATQGIRAPFSSLADVREQSVKRMRQPRGGAGRRGKLTEAPCVALARLGSNSCRAISHRPPRRAPRKRSRRVFATGAQHNGFCSVLFCSR